LKVSIKIKNYLKENWGVPFIIAFMILLIACAGLLTIGNEELANELAVYAYYFLVTGVILQLACYLKYEKRSNKSDN